MKSEMRIIAILFKLLNEISSACGERNFMGIKLVKTKKIHSNYFLKADNEFI